jgi:hypothetical protein
VDENGNVNTQVHDVASMPNPYDPSRTFNPSENLNNSIDAVSKMDMFGGAGVGFRQNDDGTGTTSYVGEWLKSADNSIAMDWKSNSFVYGCLVGSTYRLLISLYFSLSRF